MRAVTVAVALAALVAAGVAFVAVGYAGADCTGRTHADVYGWTAAAGILSGVTALALGWNLAPVPRIAVSLFVGFGCWIVAWLLLVASSIVYCAD